LNGLVNYWALNLDDTKDYVGRADANSCVNGSFVADRFGNPQSALYLNNGYCRLPSNIYLTGGDFTMTAWINLIQPNLYSRILEFSNGNGFDQVSFGLATTYLYFQPFMMIDNNYNLTQFGCLQHLNLNEWNHIAFLFSRKQMQLSVYINGSFQRSIQTLIAPTDVIRSKNYIGRGAAGDADANAIFDDLKIYNRKLSSTELQDDM
jgi:hypothetical protein